MRRIQSKILLSIVLLIFSAAGIFAQTIDQPAETDDIEVGIVEHLGDTIPLDLTFFDENGQPVRLDSLINKPTVLSLVYFECPGICTPLLSGEVEVLDRMELIPGKDYQAITISFNHRETPQMARDKKRNYFHAFKKPFPEDQWHWLTGDSVNIRRLTDAVGFRFKKSGDGFVHAAALIVLSPEGKISRYLYGITFLPFDLQMAIVEASQGRVGPTIAKMLRFCFNYDPEGRRYTFNFLRVSGAFVILFALLFVVGITVKKNFSRK